MTWQPTASIEQLKKRSQWLKDLRAFFYARSVMEVDTPILSSAATPDLHLRSLKTSVQVPGIKDKQPYFLHTSPEYPMKRLLCAGSGDIFYLGKVFRDGDLSARHQVEFTLLEWYRLGFDLTEIMAETATLIQLVIGPKPTQMLSYEQAFRQYAGVSSIHVATAEECRQCLARHQIPEVIGVDKDDKVLWEQLILTEVIEPLLGQNAITYLFHYPARDAALAEISKENPQVALRFEVFVEGMELANGYQELQDSDGYRDRFEASLSDRIAHGAEPVPVDNYLLDALKEKGLPECSGVALGVDRLFMLAAKHKNIESVIPFGLGNA
ncbi:EF-P lysine aminoacylase EpmA [Hydrogenovibrio sp. 3SP14C1]|uniref:EF-P lysine aminoacylase EpmA n=1 Tax=Hydrogenovibrio sp. 3SP14C1 TaxID=3038774 RepID=UPI0024166290|nr:EF-P lysine aminoacylase EpmA [Hydrogenovibrio sp. 3SP14C1]MDG4812308.1 EF-P lysine aminoacylase EpmA [Hydrogenovibrio sp. 3SP14C1]